MILITNATGFVGRALVRRLAARRRQTRCLLQASRRVQRLPTGIIFSTASASMGDLPALRAAMQDVTTVVHLGGHEGARRGGMLHSSAQDTANLVQAVREVGVRRFIYLSRIGVDRTSAYPSFREAGEAENVVRESGLDYTILQATVTYGAEDTFTNVIAMLAKTIPYVLPIPALGVCRLQPLWVMDLVECIEATLERDDLIGQTIPLGGPEHFTFEQLALGILNALGVRRRLVQVRAPLLRGAIALCDTLLPCTPTPIWWLDLLAVGSATELVMIQRHFGFEPHRFAESLAYLGHKRSWRRDLLRFAFQCE